MATDINETQKDTTTQESEKQPQKSRRARPPKRTFQAVDSGFIEKVIQINRVAKVVKGGKRFHFSALVVTGNGQGEVGYALGKANEVSDAIKKALQQSKRNHFKLKMDGTTIPHDVVGKYGAAKVLLRRGAPGTGIIAGGAVRAICECSGIKDILTKSLGSDNAINVLKAAIQGFQSLMLKDEIIEQKNEERPIS